MNDEKRKEIERLAGEAHDKAELFRMLGMVAIPDDVKARRDQSIGYAIAQAEMFEAKEALRRAIERKEEEG